LILGFGCKRSDSGKKLPISKVQYHDSMIIPENITTFSRNTQETYWIPPDTITKQGNYIKYLITKDSCCYDNIYINWGNDSVNRIEIAQSIRQYRSYFTPELTHETKEYLILEHGCATDCSALLFLPINKSEKVHHIFGVITYNSENLTVICKVEDKLVNDEKASLEAVNIRTGKIKLIKFHHTGMAVNPVYSIDSSKVTDAEIYLRANLYDTSKNIDVVEELRVNNDIIK